MTGNGVSNLKTLKSHHLPLLSLSTSTSPVALHSGEAQRTHAEGYARGTRICKRVGREDTESGFPHTVLPVVVGSRLSGLLGDSKSPSVSSPYNLVSLLLWRQSPTQTGLVETPTERAMIHASYWPSPGCCVPCYALPRKKSEQSRRTGAANWEGTRESRKTEKTGI